MVAHLGPDGRTVVERVVQALELDIKTAVLLPRHELPLRDLAEQHGVRLSALVMGLEPLIRDDLLVVRGDTAVVASVRADQAIRLSQLRRLVATTLAVKVYGRIQPADLLALETLTIAVDPDTVGLVEGVRWATAMVASSLNYLRPYVSDYEFGTLAQLVEVTRRHVSLGWRVALAAEPDRGESIMRDLRREHISRSYLMLESYRTGSVRALLDVVNRREDDRHVLGEMGLTRENVTSRSRCPAG